MQGVGSTGERKILWAKKNLFRKGRGANQLPLTIKPYHRWQNREFF
jgi:hypothetical protein